MTSAGTNAPSQPPAPIRCATYLTCPADPALGSAYVALGFAERLTERGFVVTVVEPHQYMPFPRSNRGTFYRQTIGLLIHSLWTTLRRRADLLLFYGGEAWLAVAVLSLLPRRLRPALVVHSNGLEPNCAELLRGTAFDEGKPRRRWFQLPTSGLTVPAFRKVDGLVVVSEFEAVYARKRRWPSNGELLVLENPLPSSLLGLANPSAREEVVGFCGGWSHVKGASRMLRELPTFLRRNPSWRFRVLGHSGETMQEAFPADLRDRIEWIPPLDRETGLVREFQRLAILLSPAFYESFGLAVAEGMASGCAIVAAPVGFAAGLRDRSEVLLCEAGRPGELARSLEELARDGELRQRVANAGYARVQQLRWQPAGDLLARTLTRWIAGAVRPADD